MNHETDIRLFRSQTRLRAKPSSLLVAFGLVVGGCSYVPNWAIPVEWYDGVFGRSPSPVQAAGRGDRSVPGQDKPYPKLSSVPSQPPATSSASERKVIAQGLVADREHARYTEQKVREETTAVPPPPAQRQVAALPAAPKPPASVPSPPPPAAVPGSQVQPAAPLPAAGAAPAPRVSSAAPRPVAPMPVPSIVQRGPRPVAGAAPVPVTPAPIRSIVQRGPRPVAAAPLPPTVAETISPQLSSGSRAARRAPAIARPVPRLPAQYTTVAEVFAAKLADSAATVTTAPVHGTFVAPAAQPIRNLPQSVPAVVRSTFNESVTAPPPAPAGATATVAFVASLAAGEPIVVKFPHGSARVSARVRKRLAAIVEGHKAQGGTIRVVGHASSRTRNLPVLQHMLANFRISLDRAHAVARELIRQGVGPGDVFIEARSDGEPLYFESMPAGEAENRRAEVYLEF